MRDLNLPNLITAARIAASPLIAALPFVHSVGWRGFAFVLYIVTAVSDAVDGKLARSRGEVTDLGRLLDPLADKLLLFATFVPMFLLQGPVGDPVLALLPAVPEQSQHPFVTWGLAPIFTPWWVLLIVVGREVFMTVFRTVANRRGVVIDAHGVGKWKAGFQYTWVGSAYFVFVLGALPTGFVRFDPIARFISHLNGMIGAVTMVIAVILTVYSLLVYLYRYRALLGWRAPA